MASTRFTKDPAQRAIGARYYPLLLASFQASHKGVQIITQDDVGMAIVLHAADQGDPAGDRLDYAIVRRTLRFDWSEARSLIVEVQELADECRRWLTNPDERRDLLGRLYAIFSQVQTTLGRENRLCPEDQDEGTAPSPRLAQDVSIIETQLVAARARFQADAERTAQFRYVIGMAVGAGVMFVICGIIALILALEDIRVIHAVGLAAGAVGACVSVLQRMTKGKLDLNAQSGDKMLLALGALRPVVGGIFGFVVYLVIRAELISILVLPKGIGAALAYVSVFAFVAGFSERFAQDVLANATNSRSGD